MNVMQEPIAPDVSQALIAKAAAIKLPKLVREQT